MKRSMLIIGCIFVTVMLVLLPAYKSGAAPPPAPAKAELEKLYELAKKEGEVTMIATLARLSMAKLFDAFSLKYPGIKLVYMEQDSAAALPRLIAEEAAGRASLDVFKVSASQRPTLEDRDILARYDWNRVFGIPEDIIEKGKLLYWYDQAYAILYNTKMVAPVDVPKSYEDLLNPKFKGKIGIELKLSDLCSLAMATSEERVRGLVRKLKDQKPLFVRGNSAVADRLVAGEVAIATGTFLYKVYWYQAKGAPVDWARISPLAMPPSYLSVLKKAPHPNAARLWAAWLMTSEAQELLDKFEFLSRLRPGSTSRQWKEIQEAKVKTWVMPNTREAEERYVALKTEFAKILGVR